MIFFCSRDMKYLGQPGPIWSWFFGMWYRSLKSFVEKSKVKKVLEIIRSVPGKIDFFLDKSDLSAFFGANRSCSDIIYAQ